MNEIVGYLAQWYDSTTGMWRNSSMQIESKEEAEQQLKEDKAYFYRGIKLRIIECKVVAEDAGTQERK